MKSYVAVTVVIALPGLEAVFVSYGWSLSAAVPDPIRVGGPALKQNALIYVALDRDLFEKNGLNVTLRDDYPTGVGPVGDMAAGELDLSVSAEYPVLARILSGGTISIIATIDKYQNEELIVRKDTGVGNISDFRGRRVGLPRGTILEFFFRRLLELNGISLSDVTSVDVNTTHSADAIADGEVEALMYFQPHVFWIMDRLGDNAVTWPGQSDQMLFGVIAGRDDWIGSHPGQIDRLLRSLEEARNYALDHPDETQAIVQKRLNQTDDYAAAVRHDHQFSLTLDRALLTAMNDEARWMIANNLTNATTPPDLREYIDMTALARVRPDAVNIL